VTPPPGRLYIGTRTRLAASLDELLDDGTGRIRPELVPLAERLLAMPKPDRALNWLRNNAHLRGYLRGLATGDIALTHDALHDLPSWRTAAHLRDLLMGAGALPVVDRQTTLFEAWVRTRLAAVTDVEHARLLRQFATWHLLPKMHAAARRAPLTAGARNHAAGALTQAGDLLGWVSAQNLQLPDVGQRDLDTWHAERKDSAARVFLRWAITSRHMPALDLPNQVHTQRAPISQQQRLTWTRRVLTDEDIELRTRVAAGLLLLFAQPVSRLVRLTVDDIIRDGTDIHLRLGTPPTPVPAPLSQMLIRLIQQRTNMNTATNADSQWLFPGGRAGQPLTAGTLRQRFQALGLPTTPTRTASLRQLVLQVPAPVIATALGYSPGTAEGHRATAGGTWSRYAATPR
jgi:hypothetical protein